MSALHEYATDQGDNSFGALIAGQRPTGSCPPDGTHRWVSYYYDDGTHIYTAFNGWLVEDETRTTNATVASRIEAHYRKAIG